MTDGYDISREIALRWTSLDLSDDKSTLVQVMAWCRQATSHYLNQCWPRSLSPHGVTRPQKYNTIKKEIYQLQKKMGRVVCGFPISICDLLKRHIDLFTIGNIIYKPGWCLHNKSTLVQAMAQCRTGDTPLIVPLLIQCIDAYMRHLAPVLMRLLTPRNLVTRNPCYQPITNTLITCR